MLQLDIVLVPEMWDEIKEEFIPPITFELRLEHSLISLSKWESKWHKPFLSKQDKSNEELMDYIKCMVMTPNVKPEVYDKLSQDNIEEIYEYINDPMTATVFSEDKSKPNREIITAELIYYWMIAANIPFECQKWHLNKLLTLIRVCNVKNNPGKKKNQRETMEYYAKLNEARKKKLNTKG